MTSLTVYRALFADNDTTHKKARANSRREALCADAAGPRVSGWLWIGLGPLGGEPQSWPFGLAHDLASIGLHFLSKFERKAKQSIPTDPSEEGVGVVSFFLRKPRCDQVGGLPRSFR